VRQDILDELRRDNPVPEMPPPPAIAAVLARLDGEPPASPSGGRAPDSGRSRAGTAAALLASAAVAIAIAVGALVLLHGGAKPAPAGKPANTTVGRLVDILGVLRRPQTSADRALPAELVGMRGEIMSVNVGTPDLQLARLATVAPWGQKVFIAPMLPLTAARIARFKHQYPRLARIFDQRQPQKVTLGLFGNTESDFSSVADIEAGKDTTFGGANFDGLRLDGFAPPLRIVMVIPDGVAKVAFLLPRQAYPGAIVYPASETITVPVHNNIAAFETDRYIDEDHWGQVGMVWYAPSGAVVRRSGDSSELDAVRPDPMLDYSIRTENPSHWDRLEVIPGTGSPSTTFTIAFRRPVTGPYRYAFRFSGPSAEAGCYSPVSPTPIVRGPDLGIPFDNRGQIADTQFSARTWCPGTYHVSVALVSSAGMPFSTAKFSVAL
jgi:hypothetical protein